MDHAFGHLKGTKKGINNGHKNGNIYPPEKLKKLKEKLECDDSLTDAEYLDRMNDLKEIIVPPTKQQLSRKPPRVGRNDTCPCGSGKKFKKCCLDI